MSVVYIYVGFWTNLFGLKPATLCGLSVSCAYNGTLCQCGFQSLRYKLQGSTEHFPSTGTTRAICTRTLNLHH